MTTNRPFFANFLSAFRARSGFQKASTSANGGVGGASLTKANQAAAAAAQHYSTTSFAGASSTQNAATTTSQATQNSNTTSSISIPTGTRKPSTTVSTSAYQRQHAHTTPYAHPSPGTSPGPARGFRSGSMSPNAPTRTTGGRRGSDASNEGFREILGAEKWYIGGRTAAGEEKFYRLGMVRRPRSFDRLSADRLSL